jgi:hypothetical protein
VIVDQARDGRAAARRADGARVAGGGHPPPLTLTAREWASSADVFPMEYADVLDQHRGAPRRAADGRRGGAAGRTCGRQVEHQVLGKLLQLRAGVLAAATTRAGSCACSRRAGVRCSCSSGRWPACTASARRRRRGARPVGGRPGGFDAAPFVRVVRTPPAPSALAPGDAAAVLAGELAGLEALVAHVDTLAVDTP